jgi:5'-methylthioadenosine phosphorylase
MGWDLVGMTQYPEVILARELEMCYVNLALVTDFDAGLEGRAEIAAVDAQEVVRVLAENVDRVQRLLSRLVPAIPAARGCACGQALAAARL